MHARLVRLSPPDVTVRIDDRPGDLANISLSGALVRMDDAIPIGRRVHVVLAGQVHEIALTADVRRHDERDTTAGCWHGLRFHDVPVEAKKLIPQLLSGTPRRVQ